MLASCLPGILPPLSPREALEVSMIHSLAGSLPEGGLIQQRPFRSPHHSASLPALVGGGHKARPGEISLAHRGVLFLDELPEFARATLEALRQPLETGEATVARANHHVTYPARFQLIAAMNPCRCGYLGDPSQECTKAPRCGSAISGETLRPVATTVSTSTSTSPPSAPPTSASLRRAKARPKSPPASPPPGPAMASTRRGGRAGIRTNAEAEGEALLAEAPASNPQRRHLLAEAAEKMRLSARAAIPAPCASPAPSPTSPAAPRPPAPTSPKPSATAA